MTTSVRTEFVRRHYSMGPTAYYEDGSVAKMPTSADIDYAERQFDAWLQSVKETAWAEGWNGARIHEVPRSENPYKGERP